MNHDIRELARRYTEPVKPSEDTIERIRNAKAIIVCDVLGGWKEWLYYKGSEDTTVHTYATMWEGWLANANLLNLPVCALDMKMLDPFINSKDGAGLLTRRLRLTVMRSFYQYCEGEGYVYRNPSKLLKVRRKNLSHAQKERRIKIPFTREEFDHIVNLFGTYHIGSKGRSHYHHRVQDAAFWKVAVTLSYWTGLRFGDICCLELGSFYSDKLIVHTDKTNTRVSLDLTQPHLGGGIVAQMLHDHKIIDKQYFFPKQRLINIDPFRRQILPTAFKRWMIQFGINDKTFHSLRHTFVTRCAEADISLEDIGELIGHANVKTTEGYNHG